MIQFLNDHPLVALALLLVLAAICIILQRASEKRSKGNDEDKK